MSVIAYVAVSLDGFLAHHDGAVSFLDDFGSDEFGFEGFMESVGALVMGSATYEQILGWGWPYGDLPAVVLTSRDLPVAEGATIEFSSAPVGEAINALAGETDKKVWIVGGGKTITAGLEAGAIDELELYIMPTALGDGIPLFTRAFSGPLTLTEARSYSNGVVRLHYSVS